MQRELICMKEIGTRKAPPRPGHVLLKEERRPIRKRLKLMTRRNP
ncbi:hypothetical protein Pint_22301 [Pistacia integerrima]|uniref:Uncharacterized protein n=1 Tax=Pistacia integerrima TaxID=434235 RepID=A0ACC0YLV0_9ROSI|nr:hypothetical protein Pint_22301 [Pistacia integerrima]